MVPFTRIAAFAAAVTLFAVLGCADRPRPLPAERTFSTMVQAGKYDNVSRRITADQFPCDPQRFSLDGLRLRQFNPEQTTEQILAAIAKDGQEPATFEELLAYNAAYPDTMQWGAVAALGTWWHNEKGFRYAPSAYEDERGRRSLYLSWDQPGDRWDATFKFLVRQK